MTENLILKTLAQTEKCFLDEKLSDKTEYTKGSMLLGERFCFQLGFQMDQEEDARPKGYIFVESPIADYISLQRIDHVPVALPRNFNTTDDYFVRTTPGLYPDLLRPMTDNTRLTACKALNSIWVDIRVPEDAEGGIYPIKFTFKKEDSFEELASVTFEAEIIPAVLPDQEIAVTQWFHADCLAVHYGLEVFSDEHWSVIENFVRVAVENGDNMMLTPIFTPPLDTKPGRERPTVQLIDVSYKGGKWSFGFEKLEKWVEMCLRCGVEYFEMAHLFTQWGAHHAPKVMADTDDGYKRIFGWDTDAGGEDYLDFLAHMLPALTAKLEELGIADCTIFHISDEPGGNMLESYNRAKQGVKEYLKDYTIMDCLSDYSFYEQGVVEHPIVANNHIQAYIDHNAPNLWTYYCCCQDNKVSNRLIAMPTARNRIIGQQFYKFDIQGFLQWGYNFYFTEHSMEYCNPYLCTDGNNWVPAGDAFSVYPAPGGDAWETMHLLGFTAALFDLRAFKLAESLCGREAVLSVIDPKGTMTFEEYTHGDEQVLCVREKINRMIAEKI